MPDATSSSTTPYAIDNTDWLKTAAIILVLVGISAISSWQTTAGGRLRTPSGTGDLLPLGYAQGRTIAQLDLTHVILTVLESWNADWRWVSPEHPLGPCSPSARPMLILCNVTAGPPSPSWSLRLSRWHRSRGGSSTMARGGWALFGLCQRMYVDSRAAADIDGAGQSPAPAARR
jgi:hypothetical protein